MRVSVSCVTYDGGSVATATGTDMETGDWVTFAGDHRPMMAIAEALATGEDVEVDVEDWQILPSPNKEMADMYLGGMEMPR